MAGLYPDVPGVRIPYDVDGSIAKYASTVSSANNTINGSWTIAAASDLNNANNGDVNSFGFNLSLPGSSGRMISIAFAQTVDISGHNNVYYQEHANVYLNGLYYSTDTSDGTDGSWSANQTFNADNRYTTQAALRDITAVSWSGVKGIRMWIVNPSGFVYAMNFRDIAFYGSYTSNGLVGWHPTLNQQIGGADLDIGDVALGTVHTKTFRIKNGNATKTANTILISSTRGTAGTIAGLEFSDDNTNWDATLSIPSIAPGAISSILYVRRTVGAGETPNIAGIAQITFTAGSWT